MTLQQNVASSFRLLQILKAALHCLPTHTCMPQGICFCQRAASACNRVNCVARNLFTFPFVAKKSTIIGRSDPLFCIFTMNMAVAAPRSCSDRQVSSVCPSIISVEVLLCVLGLHKHHSTQNHSQLLALSTEDANLFDSHNTHSLLLKKSKKPRLVTS